MTYALRTKSITCKREGCDRKLNISFRGRPRKYCAPCAILNQKEKNLIARKNRKNRKMINNSLSKIGDPQIIEKLKELINVVGREQQRSRKGSSSFLLSDPIFGGSFSSLSTVFPSSNLHDSMLGAMNDEPQQWSKKELVEMIQEVAGQTFEKKEKEKLLFDS